MPDPLDPPAALRMLTRAAGGSAPAELVGLLALDVLSPWGSTRVGVRDRPDRRPDGAPARVPATSSRHCSAAASACMIERGKLVSNIRNRAADCGSLSQPSVRR